MMKVCILFLSMMFLLAPAGKAQPKIWDETEQEKQEFLRIAGKMLQNLEAERTNEK